MASIIMIAKTMVIKHYDKVANLLAWLVECAPSRMTGTGACVFSCFFQ